jgi:hypothetical protein
MGNSFYLTLCKNRKKADKYFKVNRIKNKVIIDIKLALEENEIYDDRYNDYFNLMIYTRIIQSLNKGKDIYYIPNFSNEKLDINEILKIKKILKGDVNFNVLMFFDEFKDDTRIQNDVLTNIGLFDNTQLLKDY